MVCVFFKVYFCQVSHKCVVVGVCVVFQDRVISLLPFNKKTSILYSYFFKLIYILFIFPFYYY